MHRKFVPQALILASTLITSSVDHLYAQAIQDRGALSDPGEQRFEFAEVLPEPLYELPQVGTVHLDTGLVQDRRNLVKAYLMRLRTENLLQNHLLEAGVRIDRPASDLHGGWEETHCQLRGHFAGHWLAAVERFAALDDDALLKARAKGMISELERCEQLNGNGWIGSIPEKYLEILADHKPIWSPQYTLHKTLMGLSDSYRLRGDKEALKLIEGMADWFLAWSDQVIAEGRGEAVYGGECAGMLELWSDLYGQTGDERYLKLASRYAMPDLIRELMEGNEFLTNGHANASIPWIQGAARLYEVTGDERYRSVVETFWKQAVEQRGMFATTGANAGEFWIPSQQMGRFMGARTQEHCTVYNMIRVADYLFRWTGESRYADYIERAVYNGILAQQNPHSGMIAYFLPLEPGAKKTWGTETKDFWCCHGSLVQAQAMYEDLIYYRGQNAVAVSQFIPSSASWNSEAGSIKVSQQVDPSGGTLNFVSEGEQTHFVVTLKVQSSAKSAWTLQVRQPEWAMGKAEVLVNGKAVDASLEDGYLQLKRDWETDTVVVSFAKAIRKEALPGDESRFALLDGPIVLAALTQDEPELVEGLQSLTPLYEHQYVAGRDWQSSHFLARTKHGSVTLKPLYEVADEEYSVYFVE